MRILASVLTVFVSVQLAFADAHIFNYHRFDDDRHPSTNISSKNLREQFDYFKEKGYEIVPLSKLVDAIKNGEPVSDNWVVLTVDDGYKSFYEKGLPIFLEYGYPFALMVYVEASARKYGDFMTFEQIKEVEKYGEVGYHSYGHPHMVGLNEEKLKNDFEDGISKFEKNMGYKPRYFAYPFGEYNDRVRDMAIDYGIEVILSQNSGAVAANSDLHELDRIPAMNGTHLPSALASKFLKAEWILPQDYPKDNKISEIVIKTDENATHGYFSMSGQKTKKVKLENGRMTLKFNKPIDRYKVRMSLKVNGKTTTKILVKDINAE
ncbi:polysaccharide deacetylase family protein [Campylobacter rectus]|uniref:Polysaccharide deacetylase n=1 Tax=Campylobacter rectus TaxID=203 RepID=A0A6G5QJF3_CAMRE|nr:polysaccharide deacetylase family protein [Campylobacter rectus]QCD45843.1 polysaccharide deacetylase [Campylobacter rectus]UEB48821.1 polysaccharide deacetylase family protein [Campylobacter rectus]